LVEKTNLRQRKGFHEVVADQGNFFLLAAAQ
jgi:hypothetical protein